MTSLHKELNIIVGIVLTYIFIISINTIFERNLIIKAINIGLLLGSLFLVRKSKLILKISAQTLYIISFILIGLSFFT